MVGKILLNVIAIIISAVFVVSTWVTTGTPDTGFLKYFSIAVLICSVVLFIWDQWLWKLRPFQLLPMVSRNIAGTWETELKSLWIDPSTKKSPPPKTVYIVVRQTSSSASIRMITDESDSKSSLARVIRENGSWLVHYLYTNEPKVEFRSRSPIHHGSGVLSIVGNPVERIAGSYWTDRDSKGSITLKRRVSKYAEDFQGGQDLFA